jgi:class 3 adenylate cyclase
MDLPRGTVTFLFTDIEGSTRLWEESPEPMDRAVACHDEILRDAVNSHGGYVFKTTGDGLCAVFAAASDAVAAAVAAQRRILATVWGDVGELRVRMALHTGDAKLRNGDYFGQAPNRCGRLMAAGHGGQVLVSAATLELARDDLPPDTSLRDLGECGFRDLYRPERVAQLTHPDLPSQFPRCGGWTASPRTCPLRPRLWSVGSGHSPRTLKPVSELGGGLRGASPGGERTETVAEATLPSRSGRQPPRSACS